MTLNFIQNEMNLARKNHDAARVEVLSSLVAAIKKYGIDKGCRDNITEEMVMDVLIKEQKILKEMIDTCPATRSDLLNQYHTKMTILEEFAPKIETNPDVIKTILTTEYADKFEFIKKNRGAIMKAISKDLKGKVDIGVASKVIADMLV